MFRINSRVGNRLDDFRIESFLASPRTKNVQTHSRDDCREPTAQVSKLACVRTVQPQPCCLHSVISFSCGAKHPIGYGTQMTSVRLKQLCQTFRFAHDTSPANL